MSYRSREMFALFVIPQELKTDNGPPFQGFEFARYLEAMGVKHRKITPLWPRANAFCERFMRNLNRVLRNSQASGGSWREELETFLSNYRATPHSSTGMAPASLLLQTSSSTCRLPNYRMEVGSTGMD